MKEPWVKKQKSEKTFVYFKKSLYLCNAIPKAQVAEW